MSELIAALWATPVGRWVVLIGAGMIALGIGALVFPTLRPFALGVWAPVYRFFAGQIVLRKPGQWDARWESWAPTPPEHVHGMRGQVLPRGRWARRPGWQRQAVRLGALAALVLWNTAPVLVTVIGVPLVTGAVVVAARRRLRSRRYEREVGSLARALSDVLGIKEGTKPHQWIDLPRGEWVWVPASLPLYGWLAGDHPKLSGFPLTRWVPPRLKRLSAFMAPLDGWLGKRLRRPQWVRPLPLSDASATLRLYYPDSIAPEEGRKERVKSVLNKRLPGEWEVRDHQSQDNCYFEASHPARLPKKVELTAAAFADWSLHEIPIGQEKAEKWVAIPFKAKTPHVVLAAQTGWGKTTSDNVIMAGLTYHGAFGVILDPKLVGFVDAFEGLPNIKIVTTLEGQIRIIRQVRNEMNRRYELIMQYNRTAVEMGLPSMKDHPDRYFTPIAMLDDEKGSLTQEIKHWWKRPAEYDWEWNEGYKEFDHDKGQGKPGRGDPLPLQEDQQILWRGRAAEIRRITSAQQPNLDVFLNSDMREQYGFKVLSGPQSASAWRMTFPGAKKVNVPAKKGRAVYGIGAEDQKVLQLASISDSEARKAAERGVEIMLEENQKRAELLAEVTGRPVWEVSPHAPWMALPAQTRTSVPVHQSGTGTTSNVDNNNSRPDLRILQGDEEEIEEVIFERSLVLVHSAPEPREEGDTTPAEENTQDDAEEMSEEMSEIELEMDWIVGMAAAAQHLGYNSPEAFKKARQRQTAKGNPIPGETRREGGALQWPRLDLEEWHSKLPRSGSGGPRAGLDRAAGDEL